MKINKTPIIALIFVLLFSFCTLSGCGSAQQPDPSIPQSDENLQESDNSTAPDTSMPQPDENLQESNNSTAPASSDAELYPIGSMNWGESYEALFSPERIGSLKVMQYGAEYAGYVGVLYYSFDQEGKLFAAYYEFNQSGAYDKVEAYTAIKEALCNEYGECEIMMQSDESGNSIPAPTIDDVAANTATGCSDTWRSVSAPEGMRISAILQLYENGIITLSFYRS